MGRLQKVCFGCVMGLRITFLGIAFFSVGGAMGLSRCGCVVVHVSSWGRHLWHVHGFDKCVLPDTCNEFVMAWILFVASLVSGAASHACLTAYPYKMMAGAESFDIFVCRASLMECNQNMFSGDVWMCHLRCVYVLVASRWLPISWQGQYFASVLVVVCVA